MFATSAHLLSRLRDAVPQLAVFLDGIHIDTGLEIGSLMIKPVQRLPRYELFLQRLEKHTTGSRRVAQTRRKFVAMIHAVNAAASSTRGLEQLQWDQDGFDGHINLVAPHRTLISQTEVKLVTDTVATFWTGGSKRVIASVLCILCNDVVVFATKLSTGGPLRLDSCVALVGARITDLNEGGDQVGHAFRIEGSDSTTKTVLCSGASSKRCLLESFREALCQADRNRCVSQQETEQLQMVVQTDLTLVQP